MSNSIVRRDRSVLDYTVPITYSLMMEHLDLFCERYGCVSVNFIGESIFGRGIPAVTLGNTDAKSRVLYVGAHHGMEWITTAVLLRFINEFAEAYEGGRQMYGHSVAYSAERTAVTVIPMLNPDGVDLQIDGIPDGCPMRDRLIRMNGSEDFSGWQANGRGVDLNHNYSVGFAEYKALESEAGIFGGCPSKYSGEYPESEPESGALANHIRFDERIKVVLSLHSQGEEIFCGDGSAPGCKRLGKIISRMCGYKLSSPEGSALYGGMTDFVVGELGRPAFTLECGKGENPLPLSDYFPIYAGLREVLFTLPVLV